MTEEKPAGPPCSKCGENPPGPGGILCPGCLTMIEAQRLPGTGGE